MLKIKSLFVGLLAVAMVFTLTTPVSAQSAGELAALIAQLEQQLAMLQGGVPGTSSGAACYNYSMDLTIGSTGTGVEMLQQFLVSKGFLTMPAGVPMGYFGNLTQSALAAYQTSRGISPAAGYFGPITRGAVAAECMTVTPPPPPVTGGALCPNGNPISNNCMPVAPTGPLCPNGNPISNNCMPTTGTPTTPGGLSGASGSADYTLMSDFSSEQVGEDEADVEVAGLEIEAENSDLDITAVRLVFAQGTAGSDFEDYADEVSIWLDGEEVGRVDGDRFNDDNTYSSTVSLDGAVIREGEKGELVVAVSGVGNLDTNDAGDSWTVDFRSVRFMDATGASISEDPTTGTKTFSFESFATSADSRLDMRLTTGDDADKINKAHLINDHATDENELKGVALLEFTMEAEGDSDLEIRDFGVDIVVANEDNVDELIAGGTAPEIFLEIEGQRYGTAGYNEDADDTDVGADEEVAFTDVDYTITAGDTVTARIVANFNAADATDRHATPTILAQITETQTDDTALVDIRDESGTQIVDADIVGTPTGIASTFRDTGFDLTFVEASAVVSHAGDVANTNDHDEGTFKIVFELTAWDDNATAIFLDEDVPQEVGTTAVLVTVSGTDTRVSSSIERTGGNTSVESADTWQILAGDTVEFTVTYVTAAAADGLFRVTLEDLQYAVTDIDGNLSVTDTQIELTDSFKTPELSLNFDA